MVSKVNWTSLLYEVESSFVINKQTKLIQMYGWPAMAEYAATTVMQTEKAVPNSEKKQ